MGHLVSLAQNIIKFNGALSRTQDTGKPETIMLNYDPEYLASQYATDLKYFYQNVKKVKVEVSKQKVMTATGKEVVQIYFLEGKRSGQYGYT